MALDKLLEMLNDWKDRHANEESSCLREAESFEFQAEYHKGCKDMLDDVIELLSDTTGGSK